MLSDETRRKLRQMNIGEYIEAIELQEQDPQTMALPFEQRFQQLTDSVYQQKYDTKVRKLIKSAKFRLPQADIHDVFYHEKRPVDRNGINELGPAASLKTTGASFCRDTLAVERRTWRVRWERKRAAGAIQHGTYANQISSVNLTKSHSCLEEQKSSSRSIRISGC